MMAGTEVEPTSLVNGAASDDIMDTFRAIQEELGGPLSPEEVEADIAAPPKESAAAAPAKTKEAKSEKLSVSERVALRQEKRERLAEVAKKEADLERKSAEVAAREARADATSPEKMRSLLESGDYDGAAKALGYKSWNDMNDQAARTFASPEYKRIRAMEQKQAERDERDAKEANERAVTARNAEETRILNNFHAKLSEDLPKADDPIISALAKEDPKFIDAVFTRVVRAARAGEDLDPVEVAEEMLDEVREHHAKLNKVFGLLTAVKSEATRVAPPVRAGSTEQPVKPQTHVSRSTVTEASPPKRYATDDEWMKDTIRDLKTAQAADRKALQAG